MAGNEIGATGLVRTQGGEVDEEFLPNLQGRKAIEVYREMRDNDPVVGAILYAIEMIVRQVKWDVQENPDSDTAEEDAEFVRGCMDDMSHTWAEHVSEVLTMLPYGWSWFEIVYKRRRGYQPETNDVPTSRYDDGKIGWRKFAIRAQESLSRWDFGDDGNVKGMIQRPAPDYNERNIPITKSLLFRTSNVKGSPEGRSVLRNAYRPWYYKKHVEQQEGIGIERDLAGMPIAKVPADLMRDDATDPEKALLAAIKTIVQNIKRNKQEGIVWPMAYDAAGNPLYTLELLQGGGGRQYDTSAIIQRYDQRISMTVLADFILLGHEQVGSFALSSDKTDLFAVAVGAYLDMMEGVYNRFALPRLLTLNGMDVKNPPKIIHKDIESPPLADVAAYVSALVGAGMQLFPDDEVERYLRELGSLPEKKQDDQEQDQQYDWFSDNNTPPDEADKKGAEQDAGGGLDATSD